MAKPSNDRICVGAIAGAFGVHGLVRLKSFCADPEQIETYGPVQNEAGNRRFTIELDGPISGGFAAKLSGIDTKEEADALRGATLFVDRAVLPNLPDDEFYHADLIGLAVYDTGGAVIGQIQAVLNHGAGDLLEITGPQLKGAVQVPFTRACVPTVDLSAGRVILDAPDGLLD